MVANRLPMLLLLFQLWVIPVWPQEAIPPASGLVFETSFHHVSVNDTEFEVRLLHRAGSGPQWFFIHGWMHSADRWHELMSLLPEEWDLYAMDLPGFGRSSVDPPGNATIELYARVLEIVIAHLQRDNRASALVSHSLGGLVALQFETLVFDSEVFASVPVGQLHGSLKPLGAEWLARLLFQLNCVLPERLAMSFARSAARITVADPLFVDDLMVEDALRADPVAAARSLCEIADFRLENCPQCSCAECCVVHAELDQIVSLEDSRMLVDFLDAELVVLSGSGHTVMNEASRDLAELLIKRGP